MDKDQTNPTPVSEPILPQSKKIALSPLAEKLVKVVSHTPKGVYGKKISVDPVVSEVASFYEKIRNAMEYQEEEVVFRVAIQRILNRRLLLESNGKRIAEPLLRELAWAKYFPDNTILESLTEIIGEKIDLYIKLFEEVPKKFRINKNYLHDWMIQVLSADISLTINPNANVQIVANFMYHILQKKVKIEDDAEGDKNALVFINVRRSVAKEDKAFLRYYLFSQYFGSLSKENFENTLNNFLTGYEKIEKTFDHPLNEEVYTYVKKQTVPFLILTSILDDYKSEIQAILSDPEKLSSVVFEICEEKYQEIHRRVRRAIIRSVIFLLATKAIFALLIEGSVERKLYGHISWLSLSINTATPPILMALSAFFIKTPDRENTLQILEKLRSVLYDPLIGAIEEKTFNLKAKKNPIQSTIFIILWTLGLLLGIWGIVTVLNLFNVNFISQIVFIFFLIIVSFLIFRINSSSRIYDAKSGRHGFRSVLFYFFFLPFVLLGRRLTLSFSKINIFLFLFDFVIETPFKTMFAFFEQWFTFLRSQREKLE